MCARSSRTRRPSPAGRWLNRAVHATMAAMRRRLDLRAAAAVLAEGDVTMNVVAARLGVAKPTLYKLAGSRDELLRTCVETEAERLLGHLHEHDDVVRAVAAYADDSPGGFRLLFGQRGPLAQDAVRRGGRRPGWPSGAPWRRCAPRPSWGPPRPWSHGRARMALNQWVQRSTRWRN